jgi:hypothetical protein
VHRPASSRPVAGFDAGFDMMPCLNLPVDQRSAGSNISAGSISYVHGSPETFQPFTSRWPWNIPDLVPFHSVGDGRAGATPAPPGATGAAPALTDSQREARALLKAMADHLAGLQSFTVVFRDGYDVVQATGQKIEFGETRRITLARPNQLRVEEIARDGRLDLVLFDGKDITAFNADTNLFARAPQPGTVDDALVYFFRDLRMRTPLARLLTTRLPTEWPKRVKPSTTSRVSTSMVY